MLACFTIHQEPKAQGQRHDERTRRTLGETFAVLKLTRIQFTCGYKLIWEIPYSSNERVEILLFFYIDFEILKISLFLGAVPP